MNKKLFYTVCLFCSVLAGWNLPLCTAEPVAQYTLRFEGKKQDDNSAVALSRITISNLSQGCDTTFTSTTFLLKVLAKPSGIETIQQASSMQARLVSSNPFAAIAEVEVTLPVVAPLRLTLFGTDGKIQQHYDGRFEVGTHRFNVEPAQLGVSFLSVSNGTGQQTLKLSKLGVGGNPARIDCVWSVGAALRGTPVEPENTLCAAGAKPFVYYGGDQLQMIAYADGFANSSLYDTPAKDSEYTFLFSVPYYRIRGHQIATSRPSFVDVLFSVEDLNRNGVDNLLSDDFIIKENGVSVGGTSESFAYIRKMNTVPYKIQTVLVLDNSYSLSVDDLAKMKAAAIKLIDNKEENQEIAVYSFSGPVTLLQDFTTDKALLTQAVDGIREGTNSTNLYGAYVAGVQKFTDLFTTRQINQGFMVVFTDGDDTQASHTLSGAIGARGGKRVYMVGLGDLNVAALNQLANPGPYFPVSSADQLEQVFLSIQRDIVRYANSFYWLNFLSPKRNTGNVTLQVEIAGNPNTANDSYYQGNFNASGFEDCYGGVYIDPYLNGNELEGYAPDYTFTNETSGKHTLLVVTYYAEHTPSYTWTSSDERIAQINPVPQSFNQAELTFPENNPGGTVTITVRDEANTDRSGKHYERSVQARAFTVPKVTTGEISDITYTTARSSGLITDNGGNAVTVIGYRYGISPEELTQESGVRNYYADKFDGYLYGLQPGTTYYVQAYAVNKMGKNYGKIRSFKTIANPVVTILAGSEKTEGNADGNGANAQFNHPHGVAVDASGSVYVADTYNHCIRKITPQGEHSIIARGIVYLRRITADASGNVYAFTTNGGIQIRSSTIYKINVSGECTVLYTNPSPVYSIYVGSGITVDTFGNVYVMSPVGYLLKISPQGEVSNCRVTISGSSGLAIDASCKVLYVAGGQSNHCIYKVTFE